MLTQCLFYTGCFGIQKGYLLPNKETSEAPEASWRTTASSTLTRCFADGPAAFWDIHHVQEAVGWEGELTGWGTSSTPKQGQKWESLPQPPQKKKMNSVTGWGEGSNKQDFTFWATFHFYIFFSFSCQDEQCFPLEGSCIQHININILILT